MSLFIQKRVQNGYMQEKKKNCFYYLVVLITVHSYCVAIAISYCMYFILYHYYYYLILVWFFSEYI